MFSCLSSSNESTSGRSSWRSWFSRGNWGSQTNQTQNQVTDHQSKRVAEAQQRVQAVAEWAVNPLPLIQAFSNATNSFFYPNIVVIIIEYLKVPLKPESIFTPRDWNAYYGKLEGISPKMLKTIMLISTEWHSAFQPGPMDIVLDYLKPEDFAGFKSESIFWNKNEDDYEDMRYIQPTAEIETALQCEDPYNPGQKVKDTCLLIYMPTKAYGKKLDINKMEEFVKEFPPIDPDFCNLPYCFNCREGKWYKSGPISYGPTLGPGLKVGYFHSGKAEDIPGYGVAHSPSNYWLIIPKYIVRESRGKDKDINFNCELLKKGKNWRFPYLREVMLASFVFYAKTKQKLFFESQYFQRFAYHTNYNSTLCYSNEGSNPPAILLHAGAYGHRGIYVETDLNSGEGLAPVQSFLAERLNEHIN